MQSLIPYDFRTSVVDSTKTGTANATFTTSNITSIQTEVGQTTDDNLWTLCRICNQGKSNNYDDANM